MKVSVTTNCNYWSI